MGGNKKGGRERKGQQKNWQTTEVGEWGKSMQHDRLLLVTTYHVQCGSVLCSKRYDSSIIILELRHNAYGNTLQNSIYILNNMNVTVFDEHEEIKRTDAAHQLNFGRLLLRDSDFVPHDLDTFLRVHSQEGTVDAWHIPLLHL